MGYSTEFSLVINNGPNSLIKDLILDSEKQYIGHALLESGENNFDCKWYSHSNDMAKFSLKHPNVLFILTGQGEDSFDSWRKYYKNGQEQISEGVISYAPFDENKLFKVELE